MQKVKKRQAFCGKTVDKIKKKWYDNEDTSIKREGRIP
jgi:hypothetical protein